MINLRPGQQGFLGRGQHRFVPDRTVIKLLWQSQPGLHNRLLVACDVASISHIRNKYIYKFNKNKIYNVEPYQFGETVN
jgi:hypothetical protein